MCLKSYVREFNPELDWEYERRVAIQIGKCDWQSIVKPSLVKLLGKKVMQDYTAGFRAINEKYVQVSDVPQVKSPDFNTIEFKKIYTSRDECFQDYNKRFGEGRAQSSETPAATSMSVPDGYTEETFKSVVPTLKAELAKGVDPMKLAGDYMLTPKVIQDIQNGIYD